MLAKEDIRNVIKKHFVETMSEVDDIEFDPAKFDPSVAMSDMGATSLDLAEIIYHTTRELRAKVTPAQLSKAETVDQLVDLLFTAVPAES